MDRIERISSRDELMPVPRIVRGERTHRREEHAEDEPPERREHDPRDDDGPEDDGRPHVDVRA